MRVVLGALPERAGKMGSGAAEGPGASRSRRARPGPSRARTLRALGFGPGPPRPSRLFTSRGGSRRRGRRPPGPGSQPDTALPPRRDGDTGGPHSSSGKRGLLTDGRLLSSKTRIPGSETFPGLFSFLPQLGEEPWSPSAEAPGSLRFGSLRAGPGGDSGVRSAGPSPCALPARSPSRVLLSPVLSCDSHLATRPLERIPHLKKKQNKAKSLKMTRSPEKPCRASLGALLPARPPGTSCPDMEPSYGGGLFDMVKGGAGRLFSNLKDNLKDTLKDTSSRVIQSVSSYTKGDLDFTYVTSRIIVMSFPMDSVDIGFRNQVDDIRSFLDSRHLDHYTVYNLSPKSYRTAKFHSRVSECSWPVRQAPSLHNLFAVCRNMYNWLLQNPKNVCVVHCLDGRAASSILVGAMFIFCNLYSSPGPAIRLLYAKRPGPGLSPSHRRYLGYMCDLLADKPYRPHVKPLTIKSVTVSPVPFFNKQRNGCRPYCDVLIGETKIYSTCTDFERMKEYRVQDGKVFIPLDITVQGDVVVSVHHLRSTIGSRLQAKATSTQILQLQFHSGFIPLDTTVLKFTKPELDACDAPEKYPQLFQVTLDVELQPHDKVVDLTPPWEHYCAKDANPSILFSSHQEHQDTLALAGQAPADAPSDTPRHPGQSGFFSSLCWQDQKPERPCAEDHAVLVRQESAPSDDELLTLSSPHGSANGDRHRGPRKPGQKPQEPVAGPAPDEGDLLGLDGADVSQGFSRPVPPPTNTELLSDLFGGSAAAGPAPAGQSGAEDAFHPSGAASAQSTPRRAPSSTASPTLRVGEGAAFDPFGAPSKPPGQDLLGPFLSTSGAPGDPFLQPTRSPSPTVHASSTPAVSIQPDVSGAWDWHAKAGGFGMGSRSAATSPTGSSHGTPTHQSKPQTLDPFADLGTIGPKQWPAELRRKP